MGWFKRLKDGIITSTKDKKEAPDGLWYKCKKCKETCTQKDVVENFYKCNKCNYHIRLTSAQYFEVIFDGKYETLFDDLISKDILEFTDLKSYPDRLVAAKKKTNLADAMTVAHGKVNLIGFAGPRVIKETIKQELPEGFQTSEFLLEHGFLDFIVDRKDLKERIGDLLSMF